MSLTYTEDTAYSPRAEEAHEPFTPVYARTGKARSRKGGVPAWMILAPIGVLGVGAVAALALSGGGEEAVVAEPAAPAVAPLVAQPVPQPMMEAPLAAPAAAPAASAQAAPVAEVRAASAPRAAAPRASAPRAAARTATPVEAPVVELAGPQPYAASAQTTPAPAPFVVTPAE